MLAGEELGSLFDSIKSAARKALDISKTPAGTAASTVFLGPAALAALAAAKAADAAGFKSAPKGKKEIVKPEEIKNQSPAAMAGAIFVGADAVLSHDDVQRMINDEGNPFKKMRMMAAYKRYAR